MPPVREFEDLVTWQKARQLGRAVSRCTDSPAFRGQWKLRDQMRSAASSIMSNIAEGFDRGRRGEFHQFLSIAKGSAAEVRSQLYFAFDAGLLPDQEFRMLLQLSLEVTRLTAAMRRAVQRQRDQATARKPAESQVLSPESQVPSPES
jgi:four helix bundle protein